MRMRWLPSLLVVLAVAACTSGPAGERGPDEPRRDRLLRAADAVARQQDGQARRVEAVLTSTSTAGSVTGPGDQGNVAGVWLMQVSGDGYRCDMCSFPAGVAPPETPFMTVVVRSADLGGAKVVGMTPNAIDLAEFGHVEVLRDDH